MNKRKAISGIILGVFALLYLVVFAVQMAKAEPYTVMLTKRYKMKAIDVNKPDDPKFNKTCMDAYVAAAIAFSLGESAKTAYTLYVEFSKATNYKPVSVMQLWDYMMDQAGTKKSAGYDRYANVQMTGNIKGYHYDTTIMGMIDAGWVVILRYANGADGHGALVYGYTIKDNGVLILHYADSDDGKNQWHHGELSEIGDESYFNSLEGLMPVAGYDAIRVIAPWGDE